MTQLQRTLLLLAILTLAASTVALARGGRHHPAPRLLDAATGLQLASDRLEDALEAQVRHPRFGRRPLERRALREVRRLEREARSFREFLRHRYRPAPRKLALRFDRVERDYFEAKRAVLAIPHTGWVRREGRAVRAYFVEARELVARRLAVHRRPAHHQPDGPWIYGSIGIEWPFQDPDLSVILHGTGRHDVREPRPHRRRIRGDEDWDDDWDEDWHDDRDDDWDDDWDD